MESKQPQSESIDDLKREVRAAMGMSPKDPRPRLDVNVQDVQMPFLSMVTFMVKWAIASIPAFVILWLVGAVFFGTFGGLFRLATHGIH